MTKLTINLPESDSPDGVTLETLTAYAEQRGSKSVEEFVNVCLAGTIGFKPLMEGKLTQLAQLRDTIK